eukprot:1369648-Pyramimonas_sp.AAC.1
MAPRRRPLPAWESGLTPRSMYQATLSRSGAAHGVGLSTQARSAQAVVHQGCTFIPQGATQKNIL